MLTTPVLVALPLALLLGCGGDDSSDAAAPDAAAGSSNRLGDTCSDADRCPSDPPHQCVFLSVGNPDLGYCSPVCGTDDDCRLGYTGPASGALSCFVPDKPDACTIVCEATEDCPGQLSCVATGGPVSVCTTE
jgi:hypothetical protein